MGKRKVVDTLTKPMGLDDDLGFRDGASMEDDRQWSISDTGSLPNKSAFTKEFARLWDETFFHSKFEMFTPHWQRLMLAFGKKLVASEVAREGVDA